MIVRKCKPDDKAIWVEMNREFMDKELCGNEFWTETRDRGNADLENAFDAALKAEPSIILLIFENEEGETVGFVNLNTVFSIWSNGDAMIVDDFYIREDYRGRGYGKEGLVLVEKFALDNNIKRIQFHSNLDDENAAKIWDEIGYYPIDVKFYMRYI